MLPPKFGKLRFINLTRIFSKSDIFYLKKFVEIHLFLYFKEFLTAYHAGIYPINSLLIHLKQTLLISARLICFFLLLENIWSSEMRWQTKVTFSETLRFLYATVIEFWFLEVEVGFREIIQPCWNYFLLKIKSLWVKKYRALGQRWLTEIVFVNGKMF